MSEAAASEKKSLEGWVPDLASEADLHAALDAAFDYRGDVTITHRNGEALEGYIYDRRRGATLADSYLSLWLKTGPKTKVAYADIARLVFSGRDTAAGKSWEAWVRKYWEKRMAGEANIGLQPESLD